MNDHRMIMTGVAVICALAALSGVVPVLEWVVPALLAALALAAWVTWAIRRELRIRRRLVTPDPRTAMTRSATGGVRA
jgi:hypothetical protein